MGAMSYQQRHQDLCSAIYTLPEVQGSNTYDICRQEGADADQQRAVRLDAFLSHARSRKGKEPERLGM